MESNYFDCSFFVFEMLLKYHDFLWQSCPAINVYTADNLDKALDSATRNFCKQEVSMFTEVDEIWMSKIFLWYRDDFGGNDVDVIE